MSKVDEDTASCFYELPFCWLALSSSITDLSELIKTHSKEGSRAAAESGADPDKVFKVRGGS